VSDGFAQSHHAALFIKVTQAYDAASREKYAAAHADASREYASADANASRVPVLGSNNFVHLQTNWICRIRKESANDFSHDSPINLRQVPSLHTATLGCDHKVC